MCIGVRRVDDGEVSGPAPAIEQMVIIEGRHGCTSVERTWLGLGMLIDARRRAIEVGGCVRIVAPSRSVQKLLTLTGGDQIFPTFDSVLQAVNAPLDGGPRLGGPTA